MNLTETIRKTIAHHELIPAGAKVVVGVSGGADSVALLRVFQALEVPVTVAHLNHQLRGVESDGDEAFVRDLAEELGFPMVGKSVDVRKRAEASGLSLEMAARQARHDFFAEFGDAVVALAHHADDQVETFLLRLARGAGTEGLSGMSFAQTIGSLRLIRPMLKIPRPEILQWLEENHFAWREDASNRDPAFLRNRIRHSILPRLGRELNPNIRENILRTMEILQAENQCMDLIVDEASSLEPHTTATRLEASSTLPLAVRRRLVRKWLFEQGAEEVGFEAVEKILALMDKAEGTTVFELNDWQRVVVEYGTSRLEFVGQAFQPARGRQECLPHMVLTTELGRGWKKDGAEQIGALPAAASFDAERVGDAPITVRSFEPGDRMEPLGMEGHRKLQDIFTDAKIPRARRASIPVVVCRGEIIWIPGYRIDRKWKVHGTGEKSMHVHLRLK